MISGFEGSISFNREEERLPLPDEIYVTIFRFIPPDKLPMLSCVCKDWLKLSTCDPMWRPILDRITSSVASLLTHPKNSDFSSFGVLKFFLPRAHVNESLYQCVTRNRAEVDEKGLIYSFKNLVDTCELDTPKLRIYKSLGHPFTVVLSILIGQQPSKKEKVVAEIFFISPFKLLNSNQDENSFDFPYGYERNTFIGERRVSYKINFWHMNHHFVFRNFVDVFNRKIDELCAERIEVLTSLQKNKKTLNRL